MFKFKKDRVLLLKALRDLVNESMDVNPLLEEDVSEFLTELTNKRNARRLKIIRRELDKWITEMIHQQKLQHEIQMFHESKRKEAVHATDSNRDQ